MKYVGLICLFFITQVHVFGQKYTAGVDYLGFADNREYSNPIQIPQTFFGFRIQPFLETKIDSVHVLHIGVNALYEFGGQIESKNFVPSIYYHYNSNPLSFKIGSFERRKDLNAYPLALLSDSLLYFRPNISGLNTKFSKNRFQSSIWVDWLSRQTEVKKEQFLFGLTAKYKVNSYFIENVFSMLHDAFASKRSETDVLYDNGANVLRIGFEFGKKSSIDSLRGSIGLLNAYQRARALNILETPKGLLSEFYVKKSWFAFKNTFYKGQGLNQVYGDHFYKEKFYNRTDFIFLPVQHKKVTGEFIWSFHKTPGYLDNQQAFRLFMNI
jgi:hypothetical protein